MLLFPVCFVLFSSSTSRMDFDSCDVPVEITGRFSEGLANVAAQRAALLKEMAAVNVEEARLATMWNSAQPISRLPTETLLHIFTLYDAGTTTDPEGAHGTRSGRSTLLRVCRTWYDVLCSCPTVWGFLRIGTYFRQEYVQHCLNRSANSPLFIMFLTKISDSDFEPLLPHTARIEELCVSWPLPSILPPLFSGALRALKTFAYNSPASFHGSQNSLDVSLITAANYPCLRSLSLEWTAAPQDVQLYAQLHVLTLKSCDSAFSFNQFFNIISTSSSIREIHFWDFLHRLRAVDDNAPPSRFPMVHLRVVELQHSPLDIYRQFLSTAMFSPSTAITLGTYMNWPMDESLGCPFQRFLSLDPPNSPSISPTTTHASLSMRRGVTLRAFPHRTSTHGPVQLTWTPQSWPFGSQPKMQTRILVDFCQTLRHARLTRLDISNVHQGSVDDEGWQVVFRTFPALERLELSGWTLTKRLWRCLSQYACSSDHTSGGDTPRQPGKCDMPLPRLCVLGLRAAQIFEDDAVMGDDFLEECVLGCLRTRALHGARLDKLVLDATDVLQVAPCPYRHFRAKFLERLQHVVTDVEYLAP